MRPYRITRTKLGEFIGHEGRTKMKTKPARFVQRSGLRHRGKAIDMEVE